jgi:hypothetical protein
MKQETLIRDIYDYGRITNRDGEEVRIGGFLPGVNPDDLTNLSQVTTLTGGDVFQNLSAEGTDNTTTAVMEYGVNVFTTASPTDFCAKLPQPVTGKRSVIVNMSTQAISVHPSNVGGRINNLPVDQPLVIPNDGKAYEFICTENPLPGEWNVIAPPATSQYQGVEIEVAHTNGVDTNRFGITTATLAATVGSGIDGNQNLTLIPAVAGWISLNQLATMTRLKVYTNILQSDLASNYIQVGVYQAYKTAVNASTSGIRSYIRFLPSGSGTYLAPVGVLNSPPEIGDTNTMYYEQVAIIGGGNGISDQMGLGGQFSRYYVTFGMLIPADAATKTYKFQFFLEYV